MSKLVGWVVLSRDAPNEDDVTVVTAIDTKIAPTEEAAIQIGEGKLPEKTFRIAAFGVMVREMETKLNLGKALRRLGLHGVDLNCAYDTIVDIIAKNASRVSH